MHFRMMMAGTCLSLLPQGAYSTPATGTPPAALVISNTRAAATSEVAIKVGNIIVDLTEPLGSGEQTTVPLPKSGGCMVALIANFVDKRTVETDEFDACQNTKLRLTD